jgi:hypothetical protein
MGSLRSLNKGKNIGDDEYLDWLRGWNPNFGDYYNFHLYDCYTNIEIKFPCVGCGPRDDQACRTCPDTKLCTHLTEIDWWGQVWEWVQEVRDEMFNDGEEWLHDPNPNYGDYYTDILVKDSPEEEQEDYFDTQDRKYPI